MDKDHLKIWNDIRKRRNKWRDFISINFRNNNNDIDKYISYFIIIIEILVIF